MSSTGEHTLCCFHNIIGERSLFVSSPSHNSTGSSELERIECSLDTQCTFEYKARMFCDVELGRGPIIVVSLLRTCPQLYPHWSQMNKGVLMGIEAYC